MQVKTQATLNQQASVLSTLTAVAAGYMLPLTLHQGLTAVYNITHPGCSLGLTRSTTTNITMAVSSLLQSGLGGMMMSSPSPPSGGVAFSSLASMVITEIINGTWQYLLPGDPPIDVVTPMVNMTVEVLMARNTSDKALSIPGGTYAKPSSTVQMPLEGAAAYFPPGTIINASHPIGLALISMPNFHTTDYDLSSSVVRFALSDRAPDWSLNSSTGSSTHHHHRRRQLSYWANAAQVLQASITRSIFLKTQVNSKEGDENHLVLS